MTKRAIRAQQTLLLHGHGHDRSRGRETWGASWLCPWPWPWWWSSYAGNLQCCTQEVNWWVVTISNTLLVCTMTLVGSWSGPLVMHGWIFRIKTHVHLHLSGSCESLIHGRSQVSELRRKHFWRHQCYKSEFCHESNIKPIMLLYDVLTVHL